ncbi:hypothetical protein D9619_011926 [Psilocybe cf. subviscida]|uniref:pyranose dehydrogenase (acceptor) n=1 Tax=Psilocybe cf. subviscida TaxID=2480587 RepID=A0A8H5B253_9AGAR|nr:hypothetical protein D9619_011926 [Psilocybe cf. subviscida]
MVKIAFASFLLATLPIIVRAQTEAKTDANTYDYVVVGSGPGGGPLAARLAIAGYKVALIEAGDDRGDDPVVQIPAFQTSASEYPPIHWQFFASHYDDLATAQRDSKFTWQTPAGEYWVGSGAPNGSTPLGISYPRSGTLGGCATHNAVILITPHDSDWSGIASLTGDSTWHPTTMRQYWAKLERNGYMSTGTPTYGFSGWLDNTLTGFNLAVQDYKVFSFMQSTAQFFGQTLAPSLSASNLATIFRKTLNNQGSTRDLATGLYQLPMSINNATHIRSTHRAFLLATANAVTSSGAKKYKLDIKLNTFATKINFASTNAGPKAIGINYITGRSLYKASPDAATAVQTGSGSFYARKEVIVSGGTFNTPQLLKLSGIGPKSELQKFNIPVVLDAPAVGTNMQDRYEVGITQSAPADKFFQFYAGCTFARTADDPCLLQFYTNATDRGTYQTNLFQFMAVQKTSQAASTEADVITGGVPAEFWGYWPGYSNHVEGGGVTWTWLVLKAHSRNNAGTVTLRSANPLDMPKVDFKYWTVGGQADLQAVYEGVKNARSWTQNVTPLQPGAVFTETRPGPSIQTEAQIKQWIKDEAWGHHASCSVPIGPAGDKKSVLDSKFRVKGVQSLRVVDASVFPKIPSFYIISAVYMISEKAADSILADA